MFYVALNADFLIYFQQPSTVFQQRRHLFLVSPGIGLVGARKRRNLWYESLYQTKAAEMPLAGTDVAAFRELTPGAVWHAPCQLRLKQGKECEFTALSTQNLLKLGFFQYTGLKRFHLNIKWLLALIAFGIQTYPSTKLTNLFSWQLVRAIKQLWEDCLATVIFFTLIELMSFYSIITFALLQCLQCIKFSLIAFNKTLLVPSFQQE